MTAVIAAAIDVTAQQTDTIIRRISFDFYKVSFFKYFATSSSIACISNSSLTSACFCVIFTVNRKLCVCCNSCIDIVF